MKVGKNKCPIDIAKLQINLFQDGNTLGTTKEYEKLQIDIESQLSDLDDEDGCFYVLRTEGWSMDSIDEMIDLLTQIKKRYDLLI